MDWPLVLKVREAVSREPVILDGEVRVDVTVSIGIAALSPPPGAADLKSLGEQLIGEADVQLYRAKNSGRDTVCWNAD